MGILLTQFEQLTKMHTAKSYYILWIHMSCILHILIFLSVNHSFPLCSITQIERNKMS